MVASQFTWSVCQSSEWMVILMCCYCYKHPYQSHFQNDEPSGLQRRGWIPFDMQYWQLHDMTIWQYVWKHHFLHIYEQCRQISWYIDFRCVTIQSGLLTQFWYRIQEFHLMFQYQRTFCLWDSSEPRGTICLDSRISYAEYHLSWR